MFKTLRSHNARLHWLMGPAATVVLSASVGGMLPMGPSRRWSLNQSTHSRVAYSTVSN